MLSNNNTMPGQSQPQMTPAWLQWMYGGPNSLPQSMQYAPRSGLPQQPARTDYGQLPGANGFLTTAGQPPPGTFQPNAAAGPNIATRPGVVLDRSGRAPAQPNVQLVSKYAPAQRNVQLAEINSPSQPNTRLGRSPHQANLHWGRATPQANMTWGR